MAVEYTPVAGLTIKEAITNAIKKAQNDKQIIITNINDVVLCINADTNIDKAHAEYQQKLKFKHEIEQIKRTR